MVKQRSNNPEAKIAYHSTFDITSKEKVTVGVKQDHEIFFILAFASDEEGGAEPANHADDFGWEAPGQYFRELTLRRADVGRQVGTPGSEPCPSH